MVTVADADAHAHTSWQVEGGVGERVRMEGKAGGVVAVADAEAHVRTIWELKGGAGKRVR